MNYDLVIIGAGVASAAALITLKNAPIRIAVIAPDESSTFKIGETLGPVGVEELRRLGLLENFKREQHWPSFEKFSCWGNDTLIKAPQFGPTNESWYLDRTRFESFLWKEAQKTSFDYFPSRALSAKQDDGLWRVETSDTTVSGKLLLDASGRSAVIARNHLSRNRHDKLVAAYTVLDQVADDIEATKATLIEALPNGWFYSVLIPGNRLVVSWFTDSDLLPAHITQSDSVWEALLDQSVYTLKRIETAGFTREAIPKVVDASTITTETVVKDNLLTAGDAATSFDPLSSHGMTTALWSGRRVAEGIMAKTEGNDSILEAYADSFSKGTDKYLKEKGEIYAQEVRFIDESFWKRRHFR